MANNVFPVKVVALSREYCAALTAFSMRSSSLRLFKIVKMFNVKKIIASEAITDWF